MNATQVQQTAHTGTFTPIQALPGKENTVAELLKGAAEMVRKTEPLTLQWLALREDESHFAICDFFEDDKGRDTHFAGQVAAALKQASEKTIAGGWDGGVVAKVENSKVLACAVTADETLKAKLAVRIDLVALPGKEAALAELLTGAADIILANEPRTLLWYAIQVDASNFAIFDVFPDAEAKAAHFVGQVAALLKHNAEELVIGGWDEGVVANIRNYAVLSSTY